MKTKGDTLRAAHKPVRMLVRKHGVQRGVIHVDDEPGACTLYM
jgi:hypothetical protein